VGQPLCLAPLREVLARRLQRTQIGPQAHPGLNVPLKPSSLKKKKKKIVLLTLGPCGQK